MSYAQELADVRGVIAGAGGIIGTLFSNERIAWPGEDFDPPEPTGNPASPAVWIDVDRAYVGQELITQGGDVRRVIHLDFAVLVEMVPGADKTAADYLDALITLFTSKDTATMHYRVYEAWSSGEGPWQEVWFRRDWTLPVWREDTT